VDVEREVDAILGPVCPPGGPGAAVAVARGGEVLVRKGYGLAHLELGVPVRPEMVFRIGSLTKQFTAVALLLLAAEGRLAPEDDVRRFLPDYPTHGHALTLHHLLTHTSGVPSYTGFPEWRALWRRDLALEELLGLFRDRPLEFAPGTRFAYSNSGYVLLGAVLERVAGAPYDRLLAERLFEPLGLARTGYDATSRVVPGRVAGYQWRAEGGDGRGGWENAPYLSMTHPHAAGALLSSVDDLARWDAALTGGAVVDPEWLHRAWTAARLTDGTPTGYGYGWAVGDNAGHRTVEHGGGINGFRANALRLLDDGVFVALLLNSMPPAPPPEHVAFRIAAAAAGRPHRDPTTVSVGAGALDARTGVYRLDEAEAYTVTRDGERLVLRWTGGPADGRREELAPLSPGEFFAPGSSLRVRFRTDAAGTVHALEVCDRLGPPPKAAARIGAAAPA
jgi:CubicO group peptidase (beta-lactamase class C family)